MANDPLAFLATYLVVRDGLLRWRKQRKARKPHDDQQTSSVRERLMARIQRWIAWLSETIQRIFKR